MQTNYLRADPNTVGLPLRYSPDDVMEICTLARQLADTEHKLKLTWTQPLLARRMSLVHRLIAAPASITPLQTQEEIDEWYLSELAHLLHDYLRFRAAHEGLPYDLDPAFFEQYLEQGCRNFFGIVVTTHGLVADTQQPGIYADYQQERTIH